MPVEIDTLRSLTGRSGKGRLFSSVTAMIALPGVSGTWGRARESVPNATSRQVIVASGHEGSRTDSAAARGSATSAGSCISATAAPKMRSRT